MPKQRGKRKAVDLLTGNITCRVAKRYKAGIQLFSAFLLVFGNVSFELIMRNARRSDHFCSLDELVALFVQYGYDVNFPMHYCRDLLSALPFYYPCLRKMLVVSWRAVKGWERLESPRRAPPIAPVHLVLLLYEELAELSSYSIYDTFYLEIMAFCVQMLVMFHGMLRPKEADNYAHNKRHHWCLFL